MDSQQNPILSLAGIILAAGAASRMGQPKLLLPWKGRALIHHAAYTALIAGLAPVIVVAGARMLEIQAVLADLPVEIIHNPAWENGQSTSVRTGIRALSEQTTAAMFLLGDQPYVSVELIQALRQTYIQDRPTVLVPFVGGKRSNPVLFDGSIFEALCALQGDAGARSIFAQFPPTPLVWQDERLLFDVDIPEDYQRLLKDNG
jgi:molybdenum cofactor cytidylyltransferase